MKMKAVCELTGLTDRTVRYYSEQGLISPSCTENYLGRKSFDFSEKDVKELNEIAVLRKYSFSVDEIRTMRRDSEASAEIITDVRNRTEAAAADCREKLERLSKIDTAESYTVAELAEVLSEPAIKLPAQDETLPLTIRQRTLCAMKKVLVFAVVWLPAAISLLVLALSLMDYRYPVFRPVMIVLTVISLLPSAAVLLVSKMQFSAKRAFRRCLLPICALCVPVSFILSMGVVTASETTNIKNYRCFDSQCLVNRSNTFQALFPSWPHYFEQVQQADGSYQTVYTDARYYYHFFQGFDYTDDVYAQWPLNETEYSNEVSRATAVLKTAAESDYFQYAEIQKGEYHCVILYTTFEPFIPVTDNYTYIIFAHNDQSHTVRYIYCDSLENGADQPYYLTLDW